MEKSEFFIELSQKAKEIEVNLDENILVKFYNYMTEMLEWNKNINLTSIVEPNEIILKHFIDSITVNKYINIEDNILDIGTGAGFPGIPLKILNPENKFCLVDSLNKRINFLNDVCKKLNLKNIECIHSRAEELATNPQYRENFSIVTSRAVARLSVLLEYMLPFVKIGGKCICMKGAEIEEELKEAKNAIKILGGNLEKIDYFKLPNSDIKRNIIVIKKVSNTPKKYPRKAGIPVKLPII